MLLSTHSRLDPRRSSPMVKHCSPELEVPSSILGVISHKAMHWYGRRQVSIPTVSIFNYLIFHIVKAGNSY